MNQLNQMKSRPLQSSRRRSISSRDPCLHLSLLSNLNDCYSILMIPTRSPQCTHTSLRSRITNVNPTDSSKSRVVYKALPRLYPQNKHLRKTHVLRHPISIARSHRPTLPAHPLTSLTPTQPLRLRARDGSGLRGVGASDGTEAGVALVEDLE